MNLEYINEFVTLNQIGRFNEAAEKLFISPSSLSKHIMALEKDLNEPLITHTTRSKIELTAFGKAFLPYALQFTNLYSTMEHDLLSTSEGRSNRIIVGTIPVVSLFTLFSFLKQHKKEHPKNYIEVVDGSQNDLIEMLRNGRCDAIIIPESAIPDSKDFKSVVYADDVLSVIVPTDHPLGKEKSVTLSDLKGNDMIKVIADYPMDDSDSPGNKMSISRPSAVIDSVKNHLGIAVMPKYPSIHYSNDQIMVIDIKPEIRIRYVLVYRKSSIFISGLSELINYLMNKPHTVC